MKSKDARARNGNSVIDFTASVMGNGKMVMQNGKTGTDIRKMGTDIGKTGIYFTALLCTPRKMGKREFN